MKAVLCLLFIVLSPLGLPCALGHASPGPDEPKEQSETRPPETRGRTQSVYKINPAIDIPAFFLGGFVAVGWILGDEIGSAHCAPLCDKQHVNPLDRWSAGYYSETWSLASDMTLLGAMASGLLVLFVDHGFSAAIRDVLVVAESVMMTNALAILLNVSTRRARPYLYSEKTPEDVRNSGTAQLSFFSGHVGAITAFTTSLFGIMIIKHPHSPWPWVLLGVGTAASGVVAAGRIMAGRHFFTDVLLGGLAGICMGILIPRLHKRNVVVTPTAMAGSAGLALVGEF